MENRKLKGNKIEVFFFFSEFIEPVTPSSSSLRAFESK